MTALTLDHIGHAFLGRTVLDGISLTVEAGELVALVGPSGSGKSTLAHIAAGLVEARRGRVVRDYDRHAVVFQEPRLLPWATAAANIAFALKPLRLSRRIVRERVETVAAKVALERSDLAKFPAQLSGGMRQRVAIARALVTDPAFLIFDEPFTALDVALKRRMQDIVITSVTSESRSGLFITHDMAEAVRIAHRIAVLDPLGRGMAGNVTVPLTPGTRDDRAVFEIAHDFLTRNPLFAHVNDMDERRAG
ncbi:ABC transporter ATP-binding protein [Allorhizobium borbori]|uniref:NitT/TauT family transport system ATP-binding protein n=1 Tax=Allorhizobium borbori TaxID=485907 RepID=A0A7W6K6A2_9HYPH|nr:ATP-binding cassette domain-containing protein [Allorhizobium borbori]MBB4106003.1 NitT/TauT family transport system ATP-binding protein [Allorhizobium borbori]